MRTKLLIADHGFGTAKWLGQLFNSVEIYTNVHQLDRNSVLALEGGTDIAPTIYNAPTGTHNQFPDYKRDNFESMAVHRATLVGAGCIGICRGAQLLTALAGGKLIQDVNGHHKDHLMTTSKGGEFYITSSHHQMMYPFDLHKEYYDVLAWSTHPQSDFYLDGNDEQTMIPEKEPEVVWYGMKKFLAIQGHPEWAKKDGLYQNYCRGLVRKYLLEERA